MKKVRNVIARHEAIQKIPSFRPQGEIPEFNTFYRFDVRDCRVARASLLAMTAIDYNKEVSMREFIGKSLNEK